MMSCKKVFSSALVFFFLLQSSCFDKSKGKSANNEKAALQQSGTDSLESVPQQILKPAFDSLEDYFNRLGLVNIHDLDTTIAVDLRYSTTNNFLGEDVYGTLENAYLQPDVAHKLVLASSYLLKSAPGHRLVVYDAVRPVSVQWKMWNSLKVPVKERVQYVSNPAEGSLHNYGAAVDLSILGPDGKPLDMATEYDHFGVLAFPEKEDSLLKAGALTVQQVKNRKLLRSVMYKAGFFGIQSEWWHFNSCTRDSAKVKYRRVE